MREYTYKKETLGIEDAQKPEVDELPSVEDRGIMFLPINEIFLLSEHEISEYTLVTLYGGTQVLVDFSMYKFKEYLRKNNFIINELKK